MCGIVIIPNIAKIFFNEAFYFREVLFYCLKVLVVILERKHQSTNNVHKHIYGHVNYLRFK